MATVVPDESLTSIVAPASAVTLSISDCCDESVLGAWAMPPEPPATKEPPVIVKVPL